MYLRTCGSLSPQITKKTGSANRKSAMPHIRKVRKSNKLFKSANLRICDLQNLYSPPLVVSVKNGDYYINT
jgi:hypothetical protein